MDPSITELTARLPLCRVRDEDRGAVIYVPTTGAYYYATPAAADLCRLSEEGRPASEIAELIAVRYGLTEDAACAGMTRSVDALCGDVSDRAGDGTWPGPEPWVVPLRERIGRAADRCETFGMPL